MRRRLKWSSATEGPPERLLELLSAEVRAATSGGQPDRAGRLKAALVADQLPLLACSEAIRATGALGSAKAIQLHEIFRAQHPGPLLEQDQAEHVVVAGVRVVELRAEEVVLGAKHVHHVPGAHLVSGFGGLQR